MENRSLVALTPLVLAACVAAAALSGEPISLSAQSKPTDAASPADAIATLQWRNIGPTAQAGRVPVFLGLPGDMNTMYVAGAVGGIFKTTNGGVTWKAIFDNQPVVSIGAIAIAPTDPNVIYAGTGEGNPAQRRVHRRRRLQVDRRRRALGERRPPGQREDRAPRHRPAQRRRRVRVRARPRVGSERGTRALQDGGRREELEEGALQERPDRLFRRRHRSDQREHRVCRDVHVPPLGLVHGIGRRRDRRLQVVRRRQLLDPPVGARRESRPSEGPDGPHWRRRVAQQPEHRLRHQRDDGRRRAVALG